MKPFGRAGYRRDAFLSMRPDGSNARDSVLSGQCSRGFRLVAARVLTLPSVKRLFYSWCSPNIHPPWWMAFCCYSAERNQRLYAAFPLNLLVALAWWVQDAWARKANAPSWIEREVQRRHARRP